jgi:hypothetical protein
MSILWDAIQANWIKDYKVQYTRESIVSAFNTLVSRFGEEYLDKYPIHTIADLVYLIDIGIILAELEGKEGFHTLLGRLQRGDKSAYSEAQLSAFLSKQGYQVKLQPITSATGKKNDLTVKIGSQWLNIEVKTPQTSDLGRNLHRSLSRLVNEISNSTLISRDIHICLLKVPNKLERKVLLQHVQELTSNPTQPSSRKVSTLGYIHSDTSSVTTLEKEGKVHSAVTLNSLQPRGLDSYYKGVPFIGFTGWSFGKQKPNILLYITVPFEENRLIRLIQKKEQQLSATSFNLVALDITNIPIHPSQDGQFNWVHNLKDSLKKRLSRRIGAVLLYSRMIYEGELLINSALHAHSNPYKKMSTRLLNKVFNFHNYSKLLQRKDT